MIFPGPVKNAAFKPHRMYMWTEKKARKIAAHHWFLYPRKSRLFISGKSADIMPHLGTCRLVLQNTRLSFNWRCTSIITENIFFKNTMRHIMRIGWRIEQSIYMWTRPKGVDLFSLFGTFVWFLIRNVLNIQPIPVCHISNER